MKHQLAFNFTDAWQWPDLQLWLKHYLGNAINGGPMEVRLSRPNRTNAQNRRLWPVLRDIAKQIPWPRTTQIMREPEEWKMIFMSAYRQETNVVAGINGEFINLSLSTSELTKQEFSELLEFIQAQGAEWGVQWSDPALKVFESYREAQAA